MTAAGSDEVLAAKFAVLLPQLDERQRRLLLGAEALALGRGGIARVAAAAGVSRPTVTRGAAEVRAGGVGDGRSRNRAIISAVLWGRAVFSSTIQPGMPV